MMNNWQFAVINELCGAPRRINELRWAISAVLKKQLSAPLRRLLWTRPIAVDYRITPLGKTAPEPIDALLGWASAHLQ